MAKPKKSSRGILLGHTHWDHIQGFPFFTPAFIEADTIYGRKAAAALHDVLAGQMEFTYFPIELTSCWRRSPTRLTEGIHHRRRVAPGSRHPP